jgi:transcription termination factor NusB
MAKQVPWDEQTDILLSDIDDSMLKKYSVSLKSIIMNPEKYVGKKGIEDTAKEMKGDADNYFSQLMTGMDDEARKLNVEMESATTQYKQVDSLIANKSAILRVPYIKPLFISRDQEKEELVLIDQYNETLDGFVGKLVSVSSYVADISSKYKTYILGSWLFSGAKNHVLTINPPASPVLAIDNAKEMVDSALDVVSRASE